MVGLDQKCPSEYKNDQFWTENVRNPFHLESVRFGLKIWNVLEMTISEFKNTIFDEIAIFKWKSLLFVKSERILKDKNGSSPDKSLTSAYTWSI